jgi:O-antigen/teichoic acid export membrane protein
MADQCLASVSNFAVGVVVARIAGAKGLGAFSLAYTCWIMITTMHRALVTDPMAIFGDVRADDMQERLRRGFASEVALGLAGTCVFVCAGVLLSCLGFSAFGVGILAFAPWVTFLNIQDYWRWIGFMQGKPGHSFFNDVVFDVGQAVALAVVILAGWHSVYVVVSAWGVGAVAGAAFGLRQFGVRPRLRGGVALLRSRWHMSKWLAGSSVTEWGTSQLYMIVAGIILGPAALGGLKAAMSLVTGPSSVVIQAGSSFGLSQATKAFGERGWSGLRRVSHLVSAAGFLSVGLFGAVVMIAGGRLLGILYGPAFPRYEGAARIAVIGFTIVAFALGPGLCLKAAGRARWLFGIRVLLLVTSLPAAALLSLIFGVTGAAEAFLISSVISLTATLVLQRWASRPIGCAGPVLASETTAAGELSPSAEGAP